MWQSGWGGHQGSQPLHGRLFTSFTPISLTMFRRLGWITSAIDHAVADGCCRCVPPRPLHSLSSLALDLSSMFGCLVLPHDLTTVYSSLCFFVFEQIPLASLIVFEHSYNLPSLSETGPLEPLVQCVLLLKQWVYGNGTFSKPVHSCPMIASTASGTCLKSHL